MERQLKSEILKTLGYFSYFEHPLKKEEILSYLAVKTNNFELSNALNELVKENTIHERKGYFAQDKQFLDLRIANEKLNSRLVYLGKIIGQFIRIFPFVKGVYISGSLSKLGAKGKDYDIDYFIVASPNRIWTAKLFLMAFKKLFLLNSKRFFCINFIRSQDYLKMDKRNIFIATEISSLMPVYNTELLTVLKRQNAWIQDFFPNIEIPNSPLVKRKSSRTGIVEWLLKGQLGDKLENRVMQLYSNRTKREIKKQKSAYTEITKSSAAIFLNSPEESVIDHYYKNIKA